MSDSEIFNFKKSENPEKDRKTLFNIFWGKIRKVDRSKLEMDKVYFLKKIPFFEKLTDSQLETVAMCVYERDYLTDEYVFEIGQPGAALFIVQSGEVSIETTSEDGKTHRIVQLQKASFFGELALLNDDPRSASARASMPTKVLSLFQQDLDKLSERYPEITTKIYQALAAVVGSRLKATNEFIDYRLKGAA